MSNCLLIRLCLAGICTDEPAWKDQLIPWPFQVDSWVRQWFYYARKVFSCRVHLVWHILQTVCAPRSFAVVLRDFEALLLVEFVVHVVLLREEVSLDLRILEKFKVSLYIYN